MEDRKIDLLKQLENEISESITKFLRKSGIQANAILTIKPDLDGPREYFTQEEILDVCNELCVFKHGVNIYNKERRECMIYRKIFYKIFHDMGYRYKTMDANLTINQASYLHHVQDSQVMLNAKEQPFTQNYKEVLERLKQKYTVGYATDDEDLS